MRLLTTIISLLFTLNSFAGWRTETKKTLKEFKYACDSTQVTVDLIVPNNYIKGHITGLPIEAYEKFMVVFYVKTNIWYIHPYKYYEGQEEGYSYSNLNSNGDFQVKTIKRGLASKELAVVLVPKTFKINATKWWLNPVLGFLGGVLKYDCANVLIPGNGDF